MDTLKLKIVTSHTLVPDQCSRALVSRLAVKTRADWQKINDLSRNAPMRAVRAGEDAPIP